MNILDLKRGLLPLRGCFINDGDGEGGRGDNNAGGRANGGNGSNGNGGSSSAGLSLGLSNYGALADAATGYSPTTGFTSTQVSAPGPNNYGYAGATANADRTNVGINGLASSREKTLAQKTLDFFDEYPAARMLPYSVAVGLAAKAGVAIGGSYTDAEIGAVTSALSGQSGIRGDAGSNGTSGISLGSIVGTTSTPSAPPNIMSGLWSSLGIDPVAFGGTGTSARTPVAYQADPTGLVGQAWQAYTDYKAQSSPWLASMGDEVKRLNSADYLAQQRGKAMADVQQQSDAQMGIAQRNMSRMGVNPSSGRMLALNNQNAMQTAAAKAGAANASDVTNKQNYLSGMGTMLTGLNDQAKTGYSFGTLGQQSAQNANNFNLVNDQQNLSWTENAQKYPMQWAQLGLNKYATDKGVAQTQMNLDAKSDSDNKSLLGMGLTLGAKALDWF